MIVDKLQNKILLNEAKEQKLLAILDSIGGSDVLTKAPLSWNSLKDVDVTEFDDQIRKDIKSQLDLYGDTEVWDDSKEINTPFNDKTLPILFIVKHNGNSYLIFTSGHQIARYAAKLVNF